MKIPVRPRTNRNFVLQFQFLQSLFWEIKSSKITNKTLKHYHLVVKRSETLQLTLTSESKTFSNRVEP